MEMTFRWFGTGHDTVTLKQIRQIPGVKGVITTLYDKMPGELWTQEEIHALRMEVEAAGLKISGIESVNIHDDIKTGAPTRDMYIENYIKTLEVLGKAGINMVCYNFMPVFDWTRSDLAKVRHDGSTVLAYDQTVIDKINPETMFASLDKKYRIGLFRKIISEFPCSHTVGIVKSMVCHDDNGCFIIRIYRF